MYSTQFGDLKTTTTNYINMGTSKDLGRSDGGVVLYLSKVLVKGHASILREIYPLDAQISISDKKRVSPR